MVKINPVFEMNPEEYNIKLALLLKKMPEFDQPEWSLYVKSGPAKVRPPLNPEFWHRRAASIIRQIYLHKSVGVNRLKTKYGSKKNKGMKPEKFYKASGKIIRTILQQSEKAGILEKYNEPGKRAGRRVTKFGKELIEGVK